VIMYLMLCGYLPFSKKLSTTLQFEIQNSQIEFPNREWSRVSAQAKSLVSLLLSKTPESRPSAEEALVDPWFKHFLKGSGKKIHLKSIQNLQFFRCQTKIQQATLEYIVSHLATNEEIKILKETFMALDSNGDGKLSIEEVTQALASATSLRLNGVNEVIKRCDSDHSGFIDYTEFLSASMDWKLFLCNKKLEAAFRAFDLDGNGKIDLNELKEMIGGIDDVGYMNMMCQNDKNGDGGLDFEEFKEICLKIPNALNPALGLPS
jgi:calcium-dependent protein kinase